MMLPLATPEPILTHALSVQESYHQVIYRQFCTDWPRGLPPGCRERHETFGTMHLQTLYFFLKT